ncbi:hypothetical protein KCU93_g3514, partial [Aureobasidium melanogenum]
MFTGLLSFFVFVLSFSFLTNGEMINDQCPINLRPTLASQEYIIRFHDGYTWSQHLDHLSSTVPSLWTSGFPAKHIVNGYTATIPEDVLPHIAADPNVWGISDSGYIYVAGDTNAARALEEKQKQDILARSAAEEAKNEPGKQPQWLGKQYIVGLRNTGDVEEHLASLPVVLRKHVEQIIPEINGYAVSAALSGSSTILDSLRKDPNVGFIVTRPRGFFSREGGKQLTGDAKEDYETERMWSVLQFSDPEVEATDDGNTKIPLAWVVYFSTAEQKNIHLGTVLKDLPLQHNSRRGYYVVFDSEEQEKEFLDKIYADDTFETVNPQRLNKAMGYDIWDEELQDWVTV